MIRRFALCASLFSLTLCPLLAQAETTAPAPAPAPAQPSQPAAPGELRFDNAAFSDVVEHLRETTGTNLHVNWRALEGIGISKDTPITMHLRNVTLRTALKLLVDDVAPGGVVSWYVSDGVIEITTKDQADAVLITRVYNVDDILVEVPDFTQTTTATLQSATRGGTGGGGGNQSGGNLFGGSTDQSSQNTRTRADRAADLVKLIQDTIQPTIWKDTNPATGTATIRAFKNQLVVTAPRSVHEALAGRS